MRSLCSSFVGRELPTLSYTFGKSQKRIPRLNNRTHHAQWLGFGPETLSIPPNFELPVSSPALYGGHASLHIRYDPQATVIPYRRSSGEFNDAPAPGDNIAYLQIGVPGYRISQMTSNGGNVLDAYGWVNVVSPAGLPVRGIVGIRADPMMFLAVNCNDVGASEEFYAKLGFVRQVSSIYLRTIKIFLVRFASCSCLQAWERWHEN